MKPIVKGAGIGLVIGAVIGTLPGVVSGLVGGFVRADIGIQNASSLVIYLGLLIGGAAGSIVGALAANASAADEDDVEPAEKQAASR